MNLHRRAPFAIDQSYDVCTVPSCMFTVCRYERTTESASGALPSHESPLKKSIAFHAGSAATRGTSPRARS
jgi:hypothetical protein